MPNQPTIHLIHASDAPQHLGTLQEILQKLKAEHRIADFTILSPGDQLASLAGQIKDDDGVLTLLTQGLEPDKAEIESKLKALKDSHPGIKIAEIIVDQVTYENEFITFPSDLKPIRGRDDMDAVWSDIEQSLRDIFPAEIPEEPDHDTDWKKYLKYAIPALVIIALLVWLIPKLIGGNGPETAFKYKVWNAESNELMEAEACYAPCIVYFDNESRDYDALAWDFGDTTLTGVEDPKYLFLRPGDHTIVLTASAGNKKNTFEKTLQVKAPPYADFEIGNNGCIAPCEVTFSNKSENAANYVWEFGNNAEQSDENNPKKQYPTQGEYQVKLTATNQDGLKTDTVKTVTIREDDSPFAQFSIKKNGPRGTTPRKITFENLSKNADQYIWNFGDGSNGSTTANAPHVEHTYTNPGSYTVILTAKQNNKQSTAADGFYVGPNENRFIGDLQIQSEVLEQIYKTPELKRQWQDARVIHRINP